MLSQLRPEGPPHRAAQGEGSWGEAVGVGTLQVPLWNIPVDWVSALGERGLGGVSGC